jgi:hypothetical protein
LRVRHCNNNGARCCADQGYEAEKDVVIWPRDAYLAPPGILISSPRVRILHPASEASMAQPIQPDAHHPQSLQNVCLTGITCMAALSLGVLISAVIFAKTFWLH